MALVDKGYSDLWRRLNRQVIVLLILIMFVVITPSYSKTTLIPTASNSYTIDSLRIAILVL